MNICYSLFSVFIAVASLSCGAQNVVTLSQSDFDSGRWHLMVEGVDSAVVVLDASVVEIPDMAFVDMPVWRVDASNASSLSKIGDYAFLGCKQMDEVLLPQGVAQLGVACFSECESLEKIEIPSSVAVLPKYMCTWCGALKEVALPASLKKISAGAFQYCKALESIALPYGLEQVGSNAFAYCGKLREIEFPASVTQLESYALSECVSLQRAVLPNNASQLGELIFTGCSSLSELFSPSVEPPTFECESSIFDAEEMYLYKKCRLIVPSTSVERYRKLNSWREFNYGTKNKF